MKIYSTASSRLGIFGGGTDLEPYCLEFGGAVINMAINLRQHITLQEGFNFELPVDANPEFYLTMFDKYKIKSGISSHFDGYIKSGLGSSGAAGVCLMGAINKKLNLGLSRHEIALNAWQHEIDMGIYTGKQDQFASAYGGLNYISFGEKVNVVKVTVPSFDEFLSWISLFYIGRGEKNYMTQKSFSKLDTRKKKYLDILKYITGIALPLFIVGEYQEIAELLNIAWRYKKESNKVTTSEIDKIYDLALKFGAIGGKICGSGGGGYMMFMCPPEKKNNLIKKLEENGIKNVDFGIDFNGLEVRTL